MTKRKTAVIVLAAGRGTRMKSSLPKVLHTLAGRPMLNHLLGQVEKLNPAKVVVVVAPGMAAVASAASPHPTVVQQKQLGTAHAVLAAKPELVGFDGDVLVLYADTPLTQVATLKRMLAARRAKANPAVVVLGFRPADPAGYGRLIVAKDGGLDAIVEAKDATPAQRRIDFCNSGAMAFDGRVLFDLLAKVGNKNAKKEYYLTETVAIARRMGRRATAVEGPADEFLGVNSRAELAAAEAALQTRLRGAAMDAGVTLTAPETVWLSADTRLGKDVVVGPNVFFGPGVTVGDGVNIRAFCHIEGARIESGAVVGPFARLRPGARIGKNAHVGNFVEIKNALMGEGAKANHLSYVGDAEVGEGANIGAGTITCNYDGVAKHRTTIGAGAFIGSNTALVAPVTVGANATVGAGSVISRNVAEGALAITRAPQKEVSDWTARTRRSATLKKYTKPRKEG